MYLGLEIAYLSVEIETRGRLPLSMLPPAQLARRALLLSCAAVPASAFAAAVARPRVVAIGDLHGDLEATVRLLRLAGLIDSKQRWAGGDATLVQLGDVLDRGTEESGCFELLRGLKAEASAAGGSVVCLLGNHEVLNVCGEASNYIHASAHGAFGPDRAAAFAPGGALATELADHPVIHIAGDTAFVHATLPAGCTRESVAELNAAARRWLLGDGPPPPSLVPTTNRDAAGSPIWGRGLSSPAGVEPRSAACGELRAALDRLGVARCIVGHTPQRHVNCACGGAVWRCDTGMSRWVMRGAAEALEVSADGVRVIREELATPEEIEAEVFDDYF